MVGHEKGPPRGAGRGRWGLALPERNAFGFLVNRRGFPSVACRRSWGYRFVMADFVFNVAKGRVAEFYNRVDSNDPANSAIVVLLLATTGLEADSVLKDVDTVAALVAGSTNEATNAGYARLTLTDADLSALSPDDTNDRMDLDTADLTFGAISSGDSISKLVFAYDPDTTGGTDSSLIPLTAHDVTITPDGSSVTVAVSTFYRAS